MAVEKAIPYSEVVDGIPASSGRLAPAVPETQRSDKETRIFLSPQGIADRLEDLNRLARIIQKRAGALTGQVQQMITASPQLRQYFDTNGVKIRDTDGITDNALRGAVTRIDFINRDREILGQQLMQTSTEAVSCRALAEQLRMGRRENMDYPLQTVARDTVTRSFAASLRETTNFVGLPQIFAHAATPRILSGTNNPRDPEAGPVTPARLSSANSA